MKLEDLKLRQAVWLHGDGLDDLPVIITSLDPLQVRFPNGHIEEIDIEEISPRPTK
jgi:hypothetical protein